MDSRHFKKTLIVFVDVVDFGILLDTVTYGKVVLAAVMLKDLNKGFELTKFMEKDGMGPSVLALTKSTKGERVSLLCYKLKIFLVIVLVWLCSGLVGLLH